MLDKLAGYAGQRYELRALDSARDNLEVVVGWSDDTMDEEIIIDRLAVDHGLHSPRVVDLRPMAGPRAAEDLQGQIDNLTMSRDYWVRAAKAADTGRDAERARWIADQPSLTMQGRKVIICMPKPATDLPIEAVRVREESTGTTVVYVPEKPRKAKRND